MADEHENTEPTTADAPETATQEPQTDAAMAEAVREATPTKRELDAMSASELRTYLDALPDKVAEAVKSVIPKAPRPPRVQETKTETVKAETVTEAAPEPVKARKAGRLAGWYGGK